MLTWTGAGAVSDPTTLQVRVTRAFPGRVSAGAPAPERSLSDEEILTNLRHFTLGRSGPRTRPCTSLVLSGVGFDDRPELVSVLEKGRSWGLDHVTLHLGRGDRQRLASSRLAAQIQAVSLTVQDSEDIADIAALDAVWVTAVVLLDEQSVSRIDGIASALAKAAPNQVVFTWPLPPSAPPPAAHRITAVLGTALQTLDLAGVRCGVKGLPACTLGDIPEDRLWRSRNRFYVDAAHQLGDALLFFPDVVRFAKGDACRFCALDGRCDGAPDAWLAAGLAGILRPR